MLWRKVHSALFPVPGWYLVVMAPAYVAVERYDKTLAIRQEALRRNRQGEIPASHLRAHLSAAYIRVGQKDKAKAWADGRIESDPGFNLDANSEPLFYKDLKLTRAYLAAMRKAGVI